MLGVTKQKVRTRQLSQKMFCFHVLLPTWSKGQCSNLKFCKFKRRELILLINLIIPKTSIEESPLTKPFHFFMADIKKKVPFNTKSTLSFRIGMMQTCQYFTCIYEHQNKVITPNTGTSKIGQFASGGCDKQYVFISCFLGLQKRHTNFWITASKIFKHQWSYWYSNYDIYILNNTHAGWHVLWSLITGGSFPHSLQHTTPWYGGKANNVCSAVECYREFTVEVEITCWITKSTDAHTIASPLHLYVGRGSSGNLLRFFNARKFLEPLPFPTFFACLC